ncbi:tetraspanin-2A [Atheta coriaria]|uniref:tetraspanin-2A n=1 Tax=Dalotia coriaria TaxID=877792 RepID=UPI0031F33A96
MIRESMRRLIINAQHGPSRQVLEVIQENIGCCGADGPNDFTSLHQPLPTQCRDTVTGNPFFHGCVDELTWFFEEKTSWIAGLTMTLAMQHILNIVMSIILMKAIPMEENAFSKYRH